MLAKCNGGGVFSRNTKEIKRGFTLIELLAVIVILAIIALIATPVILNVIESSRKSAAEDSTYGYIESIEYQNQMNAIDSEKYQGISDGEDIDIEDISVNVKGKEPDEGTITINKGKVITARLCINGYWVNYENNKSQVDTKCTPGVKLIEKINPANTSSTLDSITIPINAVEGTTVTATAVDNEGNEITGTIVNGVVTFSGLRAGRNYTYTVTATDGSGNETVRRGKLTTVNFNNIDISEDDTNWTKKKTIAITTEENLNGTGTELQYKVGSGSWTKYTEAFEINENTTIYARLKNGDNTSDEETLTITTIDNVTIGTPTATVTSGGYPTITEYGIESSSNNTLKITYTAQEGTSPYYSVDNGATWTKYTSEVSVSVTSVKAKLKRDVSGFDGEIVDSTYNSSGVIDAIGSDAYDEDMSSSVELRNQSKYYINVDSSVIGQKINITVDNLDYRCYPILYFENSSGGNIGTAINLTRKSNENSVKTIEVTIPENTTRLRFEHEDYNYYPKIVEISLNTKPVINKNLSYPLITSTGVVAPHYSITIDYFKTSVQKLYKIDDENWKNYNNSQINLTNGKTLYAKGIDTNGKETPISDYTSSISLGDAIGLDAYDEDMSSSVELRNQSKYYINVDSSVIGQKINITVDNLDYRCYPILYFENSSGGNIGTAINLTRESNENSVKTIEVTIPENTTRLRFEHNDYTYYPKIVEITTE